MNTVKAAVFSDLHLSYNGMRPYQFDLLAWRNPVKYGSLEDSNVDTNSLTVERLPKLPQGQPQLGPDDAVAPLSIAAAKHGLQPFSASQRKQSKSSFEDDALSRAGACATRRPNLRLPETKKDAPKSAFFHSGKSRIRNARGQTANLISTFRG